jgi:hypothetical protein
MPDPKPQGNSFYDAYPGLGGGKPPPVQTPPFRGAGMEVGPAPPVYGPGNINLSNRPEVMNGGDVSTVRSMSANIDGREVLMPTVSEDARIMSDDEAVQQYLQTGRHLGMFDTPDQANDYERQSTLPQGNPVPDRGPKGRTKRKRRAVP